MLEVCRDNLDSVSVISHLFDHHVLINPGLCGSQDILGDEICSKPMYRLPFHLIAK